MESKFYLKIMLVLTLVVCLLYLTVSFSNTTVKSEEIQKIQTENEQQPTTQIKPTTLLAKLLASFKFLNWNFWSNPPNIFSRNLGNVGIGGVPPSDSKLYVKSDNISMNYTIYAEGGLGMKSVSTIFEGTGITGEGGHAGVCGNGYIGLLGFGYYGGWFEGKGYFSGNVSIGTLYPSAKLDVNGDIKTSGEYKYSSSKTYYMNIPTSAFCSAFEGSYQYWNTGYVIIALNNGGIMDLTCPVFLPQGATVTEFQTYIQDNDNTYNIELESILGCRNIYHNGYNIMGDEWLNTTGSNPSIQTATDTTIQFATIDNQNYQYFTIVKFDSNTVGNGDLGFYGCRITYTLDTIAP